MLGIGLELSLQWRLMRENIIENVLIQLRLKGLYTSASVAS